MSQSKGRVEQRKHKRFRAPDGTYALLRDSGNKLGQVMNISRGGLAFRYIDIGERPKTLLELDLSLKGNGFHLEKVSFKTIFDLDTTKEFPFSSTPMRRRGGQFVALAPDQRAAVEYFLLKYAVGQVLSDHPQDHP